MARLQIFLLFIACGYLLVKLALTMIERTRYFRFLQQHKFIVPVFLENQSGEKSSHEHGPMRLDREVENSVL